MLRLREKILNKHFGSSLAAFKPIVNEPFNFVPRLTRACESITELIPLSILL